MKKACLLIILFLSFGLFCSCGRSYDAHEILTEFRDAYGAEGIIYSPTVAEGEEGYLDADLGEKMFAHSSDLPRDYAVMLNSHPDTPSECGVFICTDDGELRAAEAAALERIDLLGGDRGFVLRQGRVVFYSVMSDSDRARKIFKEIMR